jgi:hypothetical protein
MGRRLGPGKARRGQVEAAPEEVHGAGLADESRAELLEHPVRLHEYAPEAVGVDGVVGGVLHVLVEGDRHRQLVGPLVDPDRHAQLVEPLE